MESFVPSTRGPRLPGLAAALVALAILAMAAPVRGAEPAGTAGKGGRPLIVLPKPQEKGSVAVGAFDDEVHRILILGQDERPLYLIPVGEPAVWP